MALLATVPVVLLPGSAEIARVRAMLYATSVLVVAVAIAELENRLAGH